jgi:Fe-S cluster assembly scaffold protein SufB
MELSTYFGINERNTGQFERTQIVADEGSYVSYLEGCTAPHRDENPLHAAVVELVALEDAQIKYSTVQNWYPGDAEEHGGIYNFVTKRGDCRGARSKISWTQVETGSAINWKYPSCILRGDDSTGEFYSVAVTRGCQQADTGTKMIHIGRNSCSTIDLPGIRAHRIREQRYRGARSLSGKGSGATPECGGDKLMPQVTSPAQKSGNNLTIAPTSPNADVSLHRQIISALKTVYDPEIPVNIVDLGLIYEIDRDVENNVHIRMTLTAPDARLPVPCRGLSRRR